MRYRNRLPENEGDFVMRYCVVYVNLFCNDLTQQIVDADSEIDAIYKSGKADIDKGELDGFETIKQIQDHFYDRDQLISVIKVD
ncbi:MAG: hypothetical protein ACRCYD_14665 [Plesiomonas sp.]